MIILSASGLEQHEMGTAFGRSEAIKFCEEKGGGRLAYRRELFRDGQLLVNDGKPYGGDHCVPVLDGDPDAPPLKKARI